MSVSLSREPGESLPRWAAPAVVALFALLYLLPLGVRPLARLDEVRYAEIAREMVTTGDWVVPHFNGVRYFEKPVLGHWLIASSMRLLGENAFAARLPGALAAGFTALILYFLTLRHTGRRGTALLAAAIFLTSLESFAIGTLAILDAPLTLFLTAAVAAWYEADRAGRLPARAAWLLAMGVACGLAFLVKGFLAFAVPVVVVGPWLLAERRWRRLLTDPWLPALAALLVSLPWALAIHAREPDFWHYFFWVEHVRRFFSDDAQHSASAWYFLVRFPVIALPWVFLLPAALAALWPQLRRGGLPRFAALWFLMPFLFFSASRGKLISYVLPCFPPLAIVLALGLESASQWPRLRRGGLLAGAALVGVAVAWIAGTQLVGANVALFRPAEGLHWLCAAGVFAALSALLLAAARAPAGRSVALVAASAIPLYAAVAANAVFPASMRENMMPGAFIEASAADLPADTAVISDDRFFGAASWYLRRSDLDVVTAGEITYGLEYPDARHRLLEPEALRARLADRSRPVLILVAHQSGPLLTPVLPADAVRTSYGPFIAWRIPARPAPPGP
jgi:4-amino-4-deoxy-L-arabinose transferase